MQTAETREYAEISNGPERRAARNAFSRLIRPYEEEALRDWAERDGLIADAQAFNRHWQAQGQQGGQEHKVYLASDTGRVFKANNLSPYGTYLEFFQSMQLHNWLFPTAPLKLERFFHDEGLLKPVVSQPFIRARASADTDGVAEHMANMVFDLCQVCRTLIFMTGSGSRSMTCTARMPSSSGMAESPLSIPTTTCALIRSWRGCEHITGTGRNELLCFALLGGDSRD